jgi:DNA (cytosine-5)-methyltransferase 1
MLTHFSVCTGGCAGIDMAAEWAGFTTVGQCEIDDYCTQLLDKNFPGVPRWRDIRDVTRESVSARGIGRIDLLSGGIPCPPHSVAGKRRGSSDERDLWPEYARVVRELEPGWVLLENVPGMLTSNSGRFFAGVLRDLAEMGYDAGWCVYGADAIGAPHQRDRLLIVAHPPNKRSSGIKWGKQRWPANTTCGPSEKLADANSKRQQKQCGAFSIHKRAGRTEFECSSGWPTQSRLGGMPGRSANWLDRHRWPAGPGEPQYEWEPPRVARGVKHRVQRMKALGNICMPHQVYPILQKIADIERGEGTKI